MCFIKSIEIAIYKLNSDSKKFNSFNTSRKESKIFENKVKQIHDELKIPYDHQIGAKEWDLIQRYYKNHQIVIFGLDEKILFRGDVVLNAAGKPRVIYILLDQFEGHYYPILSASGFFSSSYFCDVCLIKYSDKSRHLCKNKCFLCRELHLEDELGLAEEFYCSVCNRTFYFSSCFQNHLDNGTCFNWQKCVKCDELFNTHIKHKCAEFCEFCQRNISSREQHSCFFKISEPDEDMCSKIIFFDIECYMLEENEVNYKKSFNSKRHIPNLLIAHTVTSKTDFKETKKNQWFGE